MTRSRRRSPWHRVLSLALVTATHALGQTEPTPSEAAPSEPASDEAPGEPAPNEGAAPSEPASYEEAASDETAPLLPVWVIAPDRETPVEPDANEPAPDELTTPTESTPTEPAPEEPASSEPAPGEPAQAPLRRDGQLESLPRLFVGFDLGPGLAAPRVDNRKTAETRGAIHAGIHAGFAAPLTDVLGWIGLVRFSGRDAGRPNHRGRVVGFDLAVGPELRVVLGHGQPIPVRHGLRFDVPVGVSRTSLSGAEGRLVRHRYSGGWGANLGLSLGWDISGRGHGGYIDVGWLMRQSWFRRTSESFGVDRRRVHEQYRLQEHTFLVSFGYLHWS